MSTIKANYILDAAGGNTATINGAIPAPATSPTLTTPIISGNLGAGGANYGTSGQVLTSGGAGASTSWSTIATGGMTLLGTLTTTSGSTVTLSGLTLTSYQQVMAVFKNVSATSVAFFYLSSGSGVLLTDGSFGVPIANGVYGTVVVDLTTAVVSSNLSQTNLVAENNANVVAVSRAGIQNTVTSASTSISFFASAGTFDNGSIRIYGVK